MHKLTIHNFGPIGDAVVDVNRFLVLIGPQSSGKSTIAKLIYFFLHVRDEVVAFVMDRARQAEHDQPQRELTKRLRNRFVEFFGPSKHPSDVLVTYDYGHGNTLDVTLDQQEHRYLNLRLSSAAWQRIKSLLRDVRGQLHPRKTSSSALPSAIGKLASDQQRAAVLERVREACNEVFSYSKELFFIPAGRSLLSTLSDQMQSVHPHLLDFPMRQFVETVSASRAFFDKSLDEIVRARQALSGTNVRFSAVRKAQTYIKRILKGDYRHDKEGGKLYVSDGVYIKINYASSGQQEAVWILLFLFLLVLEQSQSFVVIEEPEAHLYPAAQKDLLEYISFVFNTMDCDFVLTTHSPYLLGCVNNLMYAQELAERVPADEIRPIIPPNVWLKRSLVGGYFVHDGLAENLMADDIPALKIELLDTASDLINEDYDTLLELESRAAQK